MFQQLYPRQDRVAKEVLLCSIYLRLLFFPKTLTETNSPSVYKRCKWSGYYSFRVFLTSLLSCLEIDPGQLNIRDQWRGLGKQRQVIGIFDHNRKCQNLTNVWQQWWLLLSTISSWRGLMCSMWSMISTQLSDEVKCKLEWTLSKLSSLDTTTMSIDSVM